MAVTLVIFISKAGGFLREIVMTAYYGASVEMDAYNMAYSLYYVPVLLFNSCITSTLVPLYVQLSQQGSARRLNRFSSNVVNLFAFLSIIVSILMYFLAGPLVRLTAQGFSPAQQRLKRRRGMRWAAGDEQGRLGRKTSVRVKSARNRARTRSDQELRLRGGRIRLVEGKLHVRRDGSGQVYRVRMSRRCGKLNPKAPEIPRQRSEHICVKLARGASARGNLAHL